MINPFNVFLVGVSILAIALMYFAISVSDVMLYINIVAVLAVVGVNLFQVVSDDIEFDWAENRKVAFLYLGLVLIACNLSVLFFLKSLA